MPDINELVTSVKVNQLTAMVAITQEMSDDADAIWEIYREAFEDGLSWDMWLPDVNQIVRRRFRRAGVRPHELQQMSRDKVVALPGIGPKAIAALEAAGW